MTAEERLQELKNFESQLVMQLHETQYMIKGYQNALENDNETKTDEESADKAE